MYMTGESSSSHLENTQNRPMSMANEATADRVNQLKVRYVSFWIFFMAAPPFYSLIPAGKPGEPGREGVNQGERVNSMRQCVNSRADCVVSAGRCKHSPSFLKKIFIFLLRIPSDSPPILKSP